MQSREIFTHQNFESRAVYKRALLALDIELLIEGSAKFLAPYLEIPISLERWMVMTTSLSVQELWVDTVLNETILSEVIHKIEHDPEYLPLLEARYSNYHEELLEKDLTPFLDIAKTPLHERLFRWFEWITPFLAHYYVPMFVTDIREQPRPRGPWRNVRVDISEWECLGLQVGPSFALGPTFGLSLEEGLVLR